VKKNCYNCTHGYWDNDTMEPHDIQGDHFVCEGREDDSCEFEINLSKPSYLEKAKRCCVLKSDQRLLGHGGLK